MLRTTLFMMCSLSILAWPGCRNQQGTQQITADVNTQLGGTEPEDSLFMTFERTPCFGKCPSYKVQIFRNGSATYEGTQFSDFMGAHTGYFTPRMPPMILAKAEALGYFTWEKKYDAQVTDLPSTIMRLRANGKDHEVYARYRIPAEVKQFSNYMDSLIHTVDWMPVVGTH